MPFLEQQKTSREQTAFLERLEKKPQPWEKDPLFRELTSNPPYGEGFLMKEDTKEGNHAHLLGETIVNIVPEAQKDLARCGVNLAIDIMDGKRKDGRTPEVSHVFRTTLRALNLKQLTDEELLTIILHDGIEDHPEQFEKKYRAAFQPVSQTEHIGETLNKVERNIKIMNKNRQKNNRKLENNEYLKEIENAGLGWIKVLDRIDSERGDFANTIHENFSQKTIRRIWKSQAKTLQVEQLVTPEIATEFNRTINLGTQFIIAVAGQEMEKIKKGQSSNLETRKKQFQDIIIFERNIPNRSPQLIKR